MEPEKTVFELCMVKEPKKKVPQATCDSKRKKYWRSGSFKQTSISN